MSEILVKLKIPLLMVLVCLISITGTVIYMENTEEPNKSEQIILNDDSLSIDTYGQNSQVNNNPLEGNKGYWKLHRGSKEKCPTGLNFLHDEILTILIKDDMETTGFLKKAEGGDTYILTNNLASLNVKFKKVDSNIIRLEGCEYLKTK